MHAHSHGTADEVFAPEDAVNEILNEVQEDMTALAEDARAFPLQCSRRDRSLRRPQPLASPQAWTPPAVTPSRAPVPPPDIERPCYRVCQSLMMFPSWT